MSDLPLMPSKFNSMQVETSSIKGESGANLAHKAHHGKGFSNARGEDRKEEKEDMEKL